jgi:pimeloyl-ACP methyl ester carboxylesterase
VAETRQLRASTVVVKGVRSPVIDGGSADASDAVVFVHGNPGTGHDWEDLMPRVAPFTRVIAPDMPGFGAADKRADFEYTIDGYARHLAGLLDELGVERAHLVLHDFGGPWGLAWALANPEAFASVTLINCGVLVGYRWHRYARIWRTPLLGELFQVGATRAAFRQVVGRDNPRLERAALDRLYEQSQGWATKRAVLRLYRATGPDFGEPLVARFRELDRPALVIWGSRDAYLPVEQAEAQRRSFPRARVEVLEGHGHWVFWEDAERVASLLVPFLEEHVEGAEASRSGRT